MGAADRNELIASAGAIARLATARDIAPTRVQRRPPDSEIRRVLTFIVRRWSAFEQPRWCSPAAAVAAPGLHLDHIVPCRVLVDRLIMAPDDAGAILGHGVVLARVTGDEHRRLGGIYVDHREVYAKLLRAKPRRLEEVGLERYAAAKIRLGPVRPG